jgi:hypothetical protein
MVWESIAMAYNQFMWIALLASIVGAILVAAMDQGHAEVRRPALQH